MAGRRPPRRQRGTARGGAQAGRGRSPRSGPAARGGPAPRSERGLGGTQIEGRHAVREALLAGRRRVTEIFMASGLDPAPILDDIRDLATDQRVKITEVSRAKLDARARTEAPQGLVATAQPVPEDQLDDLVSGEGHPFLLVLDGITDPGNLGALLRSAECAGVTGVVLPRHRTAHLTPAAVKAAAGAVEYLRFAVVPGIPATLTRLADAGVWSVGLDAAGPTPLTEAELADRAVALVVGAEGRGLSRLVRARCDMLVAIPLRGQLDSLNAAAAGTVACFEVARQRS